MLNSWYFKLYRVHDTWAYYLAGSPFMFDHKKRCLTVTKWSFYRYSFLMFAMAAYVTFLLIQIVRLNLLDRNNDFQYYYTFALTVCGIFDITAGYPLYRRPELAAATLTEFWHFLDDIATEFMPRFNRGRSMINLAFNFLMCYAGALCPLAGLFIGAHYFFFPDWPCYLYSVMDIPELYLVFGFMYCLALQMLWSLLLTTGEFMITIAYYTWFLTNEYFCFPDTNKPPPGVRAKKIWKSQKTVKGFRSFENIQIQYRKLQIMHLNIMEICSSFIVPMQTALTKMGVFCNFSLIKYRHILNKTNMAILLFWGVGGTFIAFAALTFCASVHVKTAKALKTMKNKNWGTKRKNMIMRKFVRSCMSLSYGYGRLYVIRKVSVLKFLRSLTRGTFRLLLTLKKH